MLPPRAVGVPTVVDGERVEQRDRARLRLAVDGHADALETHLHEQPEELPVVLRRLAALDAAQPLDHLVALAPGERVPQVLGRERQREPDGGHLDHALVDGVAARTPVLLAARDRCRCARPATQRSQCVERPTAGDERHDAPQRSRVALELGDARRERARRSCRGAPVRRRARGAATIGSTRSTTARRTSSLVAERVARHRVRARASSASHASSRDPLEVLGAHLVLRAARRRGSGGPRRRRGRPCARSRCRASRRCAA